MLVTIVHSRTAWDDHFPGTSSTSSFGPKEYTSKLTLSDTNVYVSNCLFNKCTSTGDGGALFCSTSVIRLLVDSSSFLSCKASNCGGAIHFNNTGSGQCVLHKVCGNDCTLTNSNDSLFAYVYVSNAVSSKNYVNYSSFARCVYENSVVWHTLRLNYGKIFLLSVNMSMNKCGYRSAGCFHPFFDSSSVTCSFLYSSFADNYAAVYNCICIWIPNTKHEIKCCNFLRNTQVSLDSEGTIYLGGNLMIEDCCILENKATYTFYTYITSDAVTLSNCTVDKTTINGRLVMQNTITKSFIFALNHMSTERCLAEFDSVGTLTPIIQQPSSSKKIIHCSCKPHLSIFVSLIGIFMFNFIHPNPSVYH
jgi:hypothetical protein